MQFKIVDSAGFCFGVKRAIDMAKQQSQVHDNIYTMGPLIHNEKLVKELEKEGIICANKVEDIPPGSRVVIRAHGIPLDLEQKLKQNFIISDATCVFVKKIHKIVKRESSRGRFVLIVGDCDHPEILGIKSYCDEKFALINYDIITNSVLFENLRLKILGMDLQIKGLSVVCQTTYRSDIYLKIVNFLKRHFADIQVFDTTCTATSRRVKDSIEVAKDSDVFFVVGSKASSNTNKLFDSCFEYCKNTFRIELINELNENKFLKENNHKNLKIGITAGASTSKESLEKRVKRLSSDQIVKKIIENINSAVESLSKTEQKILDSENILNINSKEVNSVSNEIKVTITKITPVEVRAVDDSGTEYSIPLFELADEFKNLGIGQPITMYKIEVEPSESQIATPPKLTSRPTNSLSGIEQIEKALKEGTIIRGRVTEIVNGGFVVIFSGIRVFIPASQVSYKYIKDLGSYLGEMVEFKIIDVTEQKGVKKAVGSIKAALAGKTKDHEKEFWDNIEIGKHYKGIIKSLVSFGAFIDLGGVDGLLHISEICWHRISHPSEMLKEGDEIEVYIKGFNRERNKVSLGYKKPDDNPCLKIFPGDEIEGTVSGITNFGVFVNLGGTDGLVHISELSWDRIRDPSEIVKIGEKIKVFVKSVDTLENKISLGYRREQDNPWNKIVADFKVGDIVDCVVMRILPFGIFVEVAPKIEGLIHISEMSNKHIDKPSDIVSIGNGIKARITEIDTVNKQISLSMRNLDGDHTENYGGYISSRPSFKIGDAFE